MKSSLMLSAALALLLPALPLIPAHAQTDAGGVDSSAPNTRAARRAAEAKKHAATNEAPAYPGATRENPPQTASKGLAKELDALIKLQEQTGKEDEIISRADAILANPSASPYDKSSAAYLAASAWQGKDTSGYANAIKYYKLAIDNNGLHNNNHYRAMLQLAQMLDAEEKHAEALAMVDRFLTETKSDDASAQAIKAQILLSMDKPDEAAAALEKQLAAKPNDKRIMMNLASVYQNANQDAKAAAMFDKMRAAGLLTESKDYEMGAALLVNMDGRQKEALALIEEGQKKGILQPSYNTYLIQGRAYYDAEQNEKAIEAWTKGAPLSKDGEMWLNVAKLQLDRDKFAEAKAAATNAKAKGVKKQGDLYQVLSESEKGLGNAAAARAAAQESAKYPETKKWAESVLRQPSKK